MYFLLAENIGQKLIGQHNRVQEDDMRYRTLNTIIIDSFNKKGQNCCYDNKKFFFYNNNNADTRLSSSMQPFNEIR